MDLTVVDNESFQIDNSRDFCWNPCCLVQGIQVIFEIESRLQVQRLDLGAVAGDGPKSE
jgi:hypothetical protein